MTDVSDTFHHPCLVCGSTVEVIGGQEQPHDCQRADTDRELVAHAYWSGFDRANLPDAARWSPEPAAQPTVDRDALTAWFHNHGDGGIWESFDWRNAVTVADALLASGVLTDAAQVRAAERRKVAEEIAAAIEARIHDSANYGWPSNCADGLEHAARIAREAALAGHTDGDHTTHTDTADRRGDDDG